MDLEGALAGILLLAAGKKGAAVAAAIQHGLEASDTSDPDHVHGAEEPPSLSDVGSSEST